MKRTLFLVITLLLLTTLFVAAAPPAAADGPLPLSAYPRPKNDNGLGIHWHTGVYAQDDEVTDYFVAEVKAMGIKWVKFLNDRTDGRHYDYLVEQLVANDIMPVMRIYVQCNKPLNLASLGKLVDHYAPMGVYYYELYNEPDIPGRDGGWCDTPTPNPDYLASIWAPAAREIQARGGYPSLPSIFPVGKNVPGWENSFFQQFLRAVKDQGNAPVLYRSWGAVHNYMINHPPDYPQDEANLTGRPLTAAEIRQYNLDERQVEAINRARKTQFEPGGFFLGKTPTEDVTHFRQFIAYHEQFIDIFGFEIPLISTEGGATVGSCEDPRYPCVDERMQTDWTLAAYEYMLDDAPDYYFAATTWLIAQKAMDYFGGTVWEDNAWYHDRKGNHLPIVEALKTHPRKDEPRQNQKAVNHWQPPATPTPTPVVAPARAISPGGASSPAPAQTNPRSLANYPRPKNDNGRGLHYAPTILGQPPEVVDRFIAELQAMNIKWVKIMQGDIPKVEHQYLVEQLVAHNIEPVIRVYKPYNDPYQNLTPLVSQAGKLGVHYFELYNEPNIAGFPGGWRNGESISVNRMLDLWIPAAEAVRKAGGYPGLPALTPGGNYDDMAFLRAFLDGLKTGNRTDALQNAWLPLHNYFLNHPFDYPTDAVNRLSPPLTQTEIEARGLSDYHVTTINNARARERLSGDHYRTGATIHQDSNAFRKFEAYGKIVYDRFGYYLPIISTEGGAIAGDFQDPRYPPVSDDDVTAWTLQAYRAMLNDVPAYYFAFTPWLLANASGGHWDPAWEEAAWYKLDGTTLPVVTALKTDSQRRQTRNWRAQISALEAAIFPAATASQSVAAPPQAAPRPPAMPALTAKIISAKGSGPGWQVASAEWKQSTTPYPHIYLDVRSASGRLLKTEQLRVSWTGGWTLLMPGGSRSHTATVPLSNPDDVYRVSIAGGSGQAVQARGKAGYSLYITFEQTQSQK